VGDITLVWIADLLPDEAAAMIDQMMEQGMSAMRRAMDSLRDKASQ